MKGILNNILIILAVSTSVSSCTTLEQASVHGLTNGTYTLKTEGKDPGKVYLDVTNEKIDVYPLIHNEPDQKQVWSIPLLSTDSVLTKQLAFTKQSLDIDLTSVLMKYRPSVLGSPAQFNTDLNLALYAGWRYDHYQVKSTKDKLGRRLQKVSTLGYDFGVFAGPGTTVVSPFTTLNRRDDEYNGILLQTGVAGFIESSFASFGLSIGYDHLLNADRKIWIYRHKPWVGFIVGIALR
jgi:hypothetical protein